MAYFPFFVQLEDENALVVGGGEVALRKIEALLEFGARVCAVAERFHPQLRLLQEENASQLQLIERLFEETDVQDQLLVIAATDDSKVNHRIADLCRQKRILVNAVDQKEDCSFYFPSYIKQDDVIVGVSTGGKSPLLAQSIRRRIQEQIPDYYGRANEQLGKLRERVLEKVAPGNRRKCLAELLEQIEKNREVLSEEMADKIIGKYADENL